MDDAIFEIKMIIDKLLGKIDEIKGVPFKTN